MSDQEASTPAPATPATPEKGGQPAPPLPKAAKPKTGSKAAKYIVDKVHVWPHLTRMEMLSAIAATIVLTIWSITIDAPLEEPSNPARTPNPSKAPWYFLGLQEMLVYFDPWIAGVVMPTLIIVGLMVIPYVDPNPRGNGYYTFRERWFAITTFLFGFLVLWISLIVLGTFFRGPGWNIFMPWQEWDPHLVVPLNNVDLNEFIALMPFSLGICDAGAGECLGFKNLMLNKYVGAGFGLSVVGLFFLAGLRFFGHIVGFQHRVWHRMWKTPRPFWILFGASLAFGTLIAAIGPGNFLPAVPQILGNVAYGLIGFFVIFVPGFLFSVDRIPVAGTSREFADGFRQKLGTIRYMTVGVLYVVMIGLLVKMLLRQAFNIKYIVQLPWFNANI